MFKVHFKRIVWFAILGLAAGIGAAFFLPKVYQSQTQLLVGLVSDLVLALILLIE